MRPDTAAQIATLVRLCDWLCGRRIDGPHDLEVLIPRAFPTTTPGKPSRGHMAWWDTTIGGVIAHGHRPGKTPAGKKVKAPHADARLTAVRVRAELGW